MRTPAGLRGGVEDQGACRPWDSKHLGSIPCFWRKGAQTLRGQATDGPSAMAKN